MPNDEPMNGLVRESGADAVEGSVESAALRRRVAELEARLEAAAANDRVLRALLDTLPDSLYVKDRELRKVLCNRMDMRYMGVESESEALGKSDIDFYSAEEAAQFYDQDVLVLSGVPLINHEEQITFDGGTHWLLTTKVPLRDESGAVVGLLGIGRNITALKQAQRSRDQLAAANQALEEASRLKDEFLANVSHELRTPLTGVLAMTEALQGESYGSLNERQQHLLQRIEASGRHLLSIINDILDLSRLDAGKLELTLAEIELDAFCRSCIQAVAGAAAAKQQAIHLCMEPQTLTAVADPRRLRQILMSLLDNAVKFTPEGGALGLHVGLDVAPGSVVGDEVRFIVWDTGIGIAVADQAKLFQPFTQVDGSLARRYAGTGLGLVLVKRMTELHGGQVSVESTPGQGSRFVVRLPWRPLSNSEKDEGEVDGTDKQSAHY